MSDKGITLEGLAAAVDALRQELATWKALAHKQDQLSADQITATQSGATAAKISQIAVNTAAIQSLAAQVAGQISLAYVTTLPATGEPLTLYLVPQGDGTAPNFCNEYLWINDAWELIGTTGAMANNGELTIQVNGVAVGTFTANQATNSAINIAVPTNTNQLVNGAGYVDAAALQAALALKQNSLNASQLEAVNSGITAAGVQQIADNATAIAGKQDQLSTAQQAAVDSGATAAKIDQIASNASAIVSLTSSKQDSLSTTQLAAVNSGVTASAVQQIGTNASNISGLQTAVSSKAADNAVVHLAGAETITGNKTFTGATATHDITPETDNTYSLGSSTYRWAAVYANTYYYGSTEFSDKFWTADTVQSFTASKHLKAYNLKVGKGESYGRTGYSLVWTDKNDVPVGYIESYKNANAVRTVLRIRAGDYYTNGTPDSEGTQVIASLRVGTLADSTRVIEAEADAVYPTTNNATDLGTSDNKWKTLNGINPGALSFPNLASAINIASSITNTAGGDNFYTAPSDGWVSVIVVGTSNLMVFAPSGNTIYYGSHAMSPDNEGYTWCSIPVPAGYRARIRVNGTVNKALFLPCQGNV